MPKTPHKLLDRIVHGFSDKYLDHRLVIILDVLLSELASAAALFLVVFLTSEPAATSGTFALIWLLSALFISLAVFLLFKTHCIIIRHSTFLDVTKFLVVAVCKCFALGAIALIVTKSLYLALALFIIDFLFTVLLLVGVRLVMILVYRVYKDRVRNIQRHTRVLVYGTSEKSVSVISRLSQSRHYEVVGVISPVKSINQSNCADVKVHSFTTEKSFENIVNELSAVAVLFAYEKDALEEKDRLVQYCLNQDVKVLISPSIDDISNRESGQVRDVKIEDLLCREEIHISLDEIKENFSGKVVMVTGAAGSIGSELCRQLMKFGIKKLILYDNAETPMHNLRLEIEEKHPEVDFVPVIGDVRLPARLDFAFRTYKPQVVFHAAAYKHVPLMEENPCEAVLVNVAGSRNVADKCLEYGIEKMVMISTDKAVNPTNIMGCTKRLAEIYVQSLGLAIEKGEVKGCTKFITTRFGNVLGSNGSVIPRFREQIAKGGPVTVTHPDITRFFMTIPEACRLVMEAATMPVSNRICVFDMGESVKIDTLARRMIKLSGFTPDVDIKVEYTGLRPGEKLYEEVLSNVENTDATDHERIRIAKVRSYDYKDAVEAADRLEELSRKVDIPTMVKYMKEIVPEYISKNSKYEIYDKH